MSEHHTSAHVISGHAGSRLNRAFMLGIGLNVAYVILEVIYGLCYDSMGLLSDAGHNLSDVASMIIALIAYKAAQRAPTERYTYGFTRATVDASIINALILYAAVALILYESINKLFHPVATDGIVIAWVAGAGVVINGLTTWLFIYGSKTDLNIRGVFLHMLADTLVSVGVVVSGVVIHFTGWYIIDPLMGIGIAVMIAVGSYSLLRDSMRLSLDGVPRGIDVEQVRRTILSVPGVRSLHHLHIWALSTTLTAMTVHVVITDPAEIDRVIRQIRERVVPLGIGHSTIEAETNDEDE